MKWADNGTTGRYTYIFLHRVLIGFSIISQFPSITRATDNTKSFRFLSLSISLYLFIVSIIFIRTYTGTDTRTLHHFTIRYVPNTVRSRTRYKPSHLTLSLCAYILWFYHFPYQKLLDPNFVSLDIPTSSPIYTHFTSIRFQN